MEEPILNAHNKTENPPSHSAEHILKTIDMFAGSQSPDNRYLRRIVAGQDLSSCGAHILGVVTAKLVRTLVRIRALRRFWPTSVPFWTSLLRIMQLTNPLDTLLASFLFPA